MGDSVGGPSSFLQVLLQEEQSLKRRLLKVLTWTTDDSNLTHWISFDIWGARLARRPYFREQHAEDLHT